MARKGKKCIISHNPGTSAKSVRFPSAVNIAEKQPRARLQVSVGGHPMWLFGSADIGGPYCWTSMAGSDIKDVLERLGGFETMNWSDIGRSGCHAVPVEELSKPAQDRLREIYRDDLDELFSFRIAGKQRVWGIRRGDAVDLLWWDPGHAVCPSSLKHT